MRNSYPLQENAHVVIVDWALIFARWPSLFQAQANAVPPTGMGQFMNRFLNSI
jgi:hypothetical protein